MRLIVQNLLRTSWQVIDSGELAVHFEFSPADDITQYLNIFLDDELILHEKKIYQRGKTP
ncbi:hypothetical protein PR048_004718 [Dryococelus australis]|uniref:Uncharacterized protein n=1 Tax=Dryococelus australis TaxID=614101 RepID=A0ABQ9I665_9NEOP|nr:hypothetical protein PR048_004718 [Dryococelus australis]